MAKKSLQTTQKDVANCDHLLQLSVESRILTIRDVQVILDRDLAELYGVQTARLNEQVKRNSRRFPEAFRFQLNQQETDELIANCDRFKTLKHSSFCPYAFTEQGVAEVAPTTNSPTGTARRKNPVGVEADKRKLPGKQAAATSFEMTAVFSFYG